MALISSYPLFRAVARTETGAPLTPDGKRCIERDFVDVKSAERSARALHRTYRVITSVERVTRHPKHKHEVSETLAYVRSDALGRVWTDVTTMQGSLL